MVILIVGLVLFLGIHSARLMSESFREQCITRFGENRWKAIYSFIALIGLLLIIYGYGQARATSQVLWVAPLGLRHAVSLLTLIAFIFLTAAYVPGNAIKSKLGHPMLLGVKLWAFAHLIVSGKTAGVVLFGAFLVWSILCFRSCRQRDQRLQISRPAGKALPTILTVVIGFAAWAAFAFYLHGAWIGVRPFG